MNIKNRIQLPALVIMGLLAVLSPAPLRADSRPAVKITMLPETPVAVQGEEFAAAFQVQLGEPGTIENIQIEAAGWQLAAIDTSALSRRVAASVVRVPFQMITGDPDELLTIGFDFDGQRVSKSFFVGPKSAARQGRDHAAIQVESGQMDQQRRIARGGGISLHFEGRIVYDRPVMLDNNNDPTGGTIPVGVDYIWVEVIDEDDISTETIWSGHTDKDGYFDSHEITWDDCDPVCDDPDIYVRWECDTHIVNVQDANDIFEEDWSWSTESNTIDDFTGSEVNFGTLKPNDSGQMPILHIHNSITRAHRWIEFQSGSGIITNHVDVQWPEDEAGAGAYHIGFFDEIYISPSRQWHEDTHTHEFGHHFLDEYAVNQGDNYCNGFCDTSEDDCGHCMWCEETVLDAWNEGWPNWLADVVTRYYPTAYTFSDGTVYTPLKTRSLETIDSCDEDNDNFHDPFRTEGFVGAVLRDIEDIGSDPQPRTVGDFDVVVRADCLALGTDEIFTLAVDFAPTTLESFLFYFLANYPEHIPRLYNTVRNISLDFERLFPTDTQAPGIVEEVRTRTHPVGEGGPLPCIVLDWDTPPDDVTGANRYSIEWGTSPAGAAPDQSVEIFGSCVTVTFGPQQFDDYYVSIKALDHVGNWSAGWEVFGPFSVTDCNTNGIIDVCEVTCAPDGLYDFLTCSGLDSFCASQPDCGFAQDCNGNAAPDDCDIADGTSEDCNANGVPDECENIGHWGDGTGEWHTGANWQEQAIPGQNFHICVEDDPADVTVTYHEGTTDVATLACAESLLLESRTYPAAEAYLTINDASFIQGDLTIRHARNDVRLTTMDTLTIDGLLTLDSGKLNGPGTVFANGGLSVLGGIRVEDKILELYGDSDSFGRILIGGGAVIHNNVGATWTIVDNSPFNSGFISQTGGTLVNDGTIRMTIEDRRAVISCAIENAGEFRIDAGTLEWWGTTTSTGSVIGAPGATFLLACGNKEFLPGSTIDVDMLKMAGGNCGVTNIRGTVNIGFSIDNVSSSRLTFTDEANIISYGPNVSAPNFAHIIFDATVGDTVHFDSLLSGTLTFNSPDPLEIENLSIGGNGSGGGIMTTGPITVNQLFTWNAGASLSGPGVVNINGDMVLPTGGAQSTLASKEMNIAGLCTMNGGFRMTGSSALNILPTGTVDFAVDTSITGGSTIPISNAGRIVKSGGTGVSTISLLVTNTGIVEVLIGTLRLDRWPYIQTEGETILNGGNLETWNSNSPIALQGGVLKGTGLIAANTNNTGGVVQPGFSIGAIVIDGNYTQAAPGALEIELEGTNDGEFDVLQVSGTATLAGELQIVEGDGYTPSVGDVFVILTANLVSGQFETITGPSYYKVKYEDKSVMLVNPSPADIDITGDVDLHDWSLVQRCFSGSDVPPAADCPAEIDADLDDDGDVDLDDASIFLADGLTGPE